MNLRSQALSGFRWTAGVRLLSQVITWAITIVVVRLLSPADYGLLAMATVFVAFLAMFSELGLGAALVQRANVDDQLLKHAFGVILILHFVLAVLLILLAPAIGAFYDELRVVPVIRILSLQFVLAAFAVIPNAQLQRKMEFRNRSLLDLSSAIVASVTTLTMAYAGAGVWALVVGSLVSQVVKTLGLNWLSPFLHWPEFSIVGANPLLRFGGHFTAIQVIWVFLSQVDVLICAKLLGKEVLGFYAVAMDLASMPSQRISGLVNQVAFPTFSRMQHDLPSVRANVLLGIRILSVFAFPVLWGLSSIASEIVEVILGDKWTTSTLPLQVLTLIIPLRLVSNFVSTALQGIGRSDVVLRNVIFASLISPLALFIGAFWWGLSGLIIAWLFASPLIFLQGAMRSMSALEVRLSQLGVAMLPAAAVSLVMYCVITVVRHLWMVGETGPVRLCVLIATGAFLYCAMSILFNRKGTLEVIAMLRGIATSK